MVGAFPAEIVPYQKEGEYVNSAYGRLAPTSLPGPARLAARSLEDGRFAPLATKVGMLDACQSVTQGELS